MGSIKKIKIGNDTYDIHDSRIPDISSLGQTEKRTFTYLHPSSSKLSVIFFRVRQTSWNKIGTIRYRLTAEIEGVDQSSESCDVMLQFASGALKAYYSKNAVQNTSYRPIYYTTFVPINEAGYNANASYGNLVGVYNNYDCYQWLAKARNYTVEVYYTENCEVMWLDEALNASDVYPLYGGSSYYGSLRNIDAANQGLQETGDSNTHSSLQLTYSTVLVGDAGIKGYTFVMKDRSGKWQSIVKSTSTAATGKVSNVCGFFPDSLRYYATSTALNSGGEVGTSVLYEAYSLVDVRYDFNGITTSASTSALVAGKPVYLKGTLVRGLFYLDVNNWLAQEIPETESPYVYLYLGDAYGPYRVAFPAKHPMYYYESGDGVIREISTGVYDRDELYMLHALRQSVAVVDLLEYDCSRTYIGDVETLGYVPLIIYDKNGGACFSMIPGAAPDSLYTSAADYLDEIEGTGDYDIKALYGEYTYIEGVLDSVSMVIAFEKDYEYGSIYLATWDI